MTQVHNQLTRGPWTVALKGALGLSKSEGGVERFGETMQPVVDLWSLPEWSFLRDEWLWAGNQTAAAVAAEGSIVALVNPADSGCIVVVEKVSAAGGAAMSVQLGLELDTVLAATLAAQGTVRARDNRWVLRQNQIAPSAYAFVPPIIRQGSDPALPLNTALDVVVVATTSIASFNSPPYVLRPGTGLWVQGQTVNTSVTAQFSGRARVGFSAELLA